MRTDLTDREHEVAELVSQGLTHKETADVLGITARTVKAHCGMIRAKLDVPKTRLIGQAWRDRYDKH